MRQLFLCLFITCSIALLFSQTVQNEGRKYYISVQTIDLKEAPAFFTGVIGKLKLGDEVTIISERGKWAQIQAGQLSGWVASTSLSSRRIVPAGTGGGASELALAGKGFTEEMEIEYRKNGLDYSIVDLMEGMLIPNEELFNFITSGRLARGEN